MSPELEEHVTQLAHELDVIVLPPWVIEADDCVELPCGAAGHIEFDEGGSGPDPFIWVSEEPLTAEAYLVALHELGHHFTDPEGGHTTWHYERAAWEWAEAHSLIPITPHLRAFIERRLDSYRD